MSIPVPLRRDFDATGLRRLARNSKDANQTRQLLVLATIYAGSTRTQAADVGGVWLQVVRDWVVRFNADGPAGPAQQHASTCPCRLIKVGPIPAVHGVVRWRLVDLAQWIWEEFRIPVSQTTLGRVLNKMGYRKLSARPRHHAQNPDAAAAFKKISPPAWWRSRPARRPVTSRPSSA